MLYSEEYKIMKERTFNAYMIKSIRNVFLDYYAGRNRDFDSLNETTDGGDELINLLVGDIDVILPEKIVPKRLEDIFTNKLLYNIVKSLTEREKLAIFLYYLSDKKVFEMADLLGFKSPDSVKRNCERAIEKIKTRFYEKGGFNND